MTANNEPASITWLRRALAAPVFNTDEDKAQAGKFLNNFLPVAIGLLGIRTVFGFIQLGFNLSDFELAVLGLMLALGVLWGLNRLGYVLAAASALLLVTFLAMVVVASQANGVFDGAFAALSVVIVMAGLLIDRRAVLGMMALSIAAAWWLAGRSAGSRLILEPNAWPEYARDISIVFATLGILTILLIGSLRRALAQSRSSEHNLRQQNAELSGLRRSLEDLVRARTEQLRVSAEVGRATTSILDADQLLREAVNLITDQFGFYYAAIFTLDKTGKTAILREATGEAGRILKESGHQLAVTNLSMVGSAILTRQARIALDVGQDTERFANPLLPDTRSEITLPLLVGTRVIGALNVQATQTDAFDEASADVLQTMANQLAVALINADTFSQAERQAHVMAVLNQLSRELAQATTLADISTATAKHVVELARPNRLTLSLLTTNPNQFMVYPLYLAADSALGQGQPVEISQTITGDSFRRGETVYTSDLTTLIARYPTAAALYAEGSRAILTVPLRAGQRALGTLNISSPQLNGFSPEQITQLEQVAAQLAVALENYNLSEQTRSTLQELNAANRRLIGQAWESYTRSSDMLTGEWRDGQWAVTPTPQPSSISGPQLQVPIRVRGETIGEFSVQTTDQRIWTPDDIAFAQALIDQVGQVIENARLLEETGRFAQREQRIRQITTRIRAASDVQAVLEATTTELAQSLGVSRAIMRLTMSDTAETGGTDTPGR